MPQSGQTRTVKAMHEEIAKAGKKRSKPVDNTVDQQPSHRQPSEVANESFQKVANEGLHRQPDRQPPEVAQTQENTVLDSLNKNSFKELNTVLGNLNESQRSEIKRAGLTEAEATEALTNLLAAYQAEGLTPNPDRLATEVIQLAEIGRGIS